MTQIVISINIDIVYMLGINTSINVDNTISYFIDENDNILKIEIYS